MKDAWQGNLLQGVATDRDIVPATLRQEEGITDMRYDAKKETWMPMEIRGVSGYFNDMRIDRGTVPDWFHVWELADGDSDGTPCRYKAAILVNFYGTFITTGELPIDDAEWNEGYISSEDEWGFTGGRVLSVPVHT